MEKYSKLMRLEITKHQLSETDPFQYCHTKYFTEDDNIIFDYLEVQANDNKDEREWVEYIVPYLTYLEKKESLGFVDKHCTKIKYSILFINDKNIRHYIHC